MNYQWHYDRLIETRRDRVLEKDVYTENHHIVMRSMGGTEDESNKVRLTAREHFLAHWLLWRIYENKGGKLSQSAAFAFYSMRRVCKSSRAYDELKKTFSTKIREILTGRKISEETRKKLKLILSDRTGYKRYWVNLDIEKKNELIKNLHKYAHTSDVHNKIKKSMSDFFKTDSGRILQLKLARGRCKHLFPIIQEDLMGNFIKKWEDMMEIRAIYPSWSSNISACLNGKRKQAYNSVWKRYIEQT